MKTNTVDNERACRRSFEGGEQPVIIIFKEEERENFDNFVKKCHFYNLSPSWEGGGRNSYIPVDPRLR